MVTNVYQVYAPLMVERDASTGKFVCMRDVHGNAVITASDFAVAFPTDMYTYEKTTNSAAPVITPASGVAGTVVFTATHGTWTHEPLSYAYQWQQDGVDIGAATATTYATVGDDAAHEITCNVTATNIAGAAVAATASNGVTPSA